MKKKDKKENKKKNVLKIILVITIELIVVALSVFLIVFFYNKNKTTVVTCKSEFADEFFESKTAITINYKDNKINGHKREEVITSTYNDLLELQEDGYKTDGFETKLNKDRLTVTKWLSTSMKPKRLINNYLNSGYNCEEG